MLVGKPAPAAPSSNAGHPLFADVLGAQHAQETEPSPEHGKVPSRDLRGAQKDPAKEPAATQQSPAAQPPSAINAPLPLPLEPASLMIPGLGLTTANDRLENSEGQQGPSPEAVPGVAAHAEARPFLPANIEGNAARQVRSPANPSDASSPGASLENLPPSQPIAIPDTTALPPAVAGNSTQGIPAQNENTVQSTPGPNNANRPNQPEGDATKPDIPGLFVPVAQDSVPAPGSPVQLMRPSPENNDKQSPTLDSKANGTAAQNTPVETQAVAANANSPVPVAVNPLTVTVARVKGNPAPSSQAIDPAIRAAAIKVNGLRVPSGAKLPSTKPENRSVDGRPAASETQAAGSSKPERDSVIESRTKADESHGEEPAENSASTHPDGEHTPRSFSGLLNSQAGGEKPATQGEAGPIQARQAAAPMTPAQTGFDAGVSFAGLPAASLIERFRNTELHFGMQAGEFGRVEVRTSLDQHAVTAKIVVERADLGRALETELPSLHRRMSDLDIPVAKIALYEQSAAMAGDANRHSRAQDWTTTQVPRNARSESDAETKTTPPLEPTESADGLSIRI